MEDLFGNNTEEATWHDYFVTQTPMGKLLQSNNLFQTLQDGKGLTLIHITPNLEQIEKSGILYPSGGCLGASIYCTPLRADQTMHNLSEFLLQKELPFSLSAQNRPSSSIEIIAVVIPQQNFNNMQTALRGIDYLRLGKIYLKIFKQAHSSCPTSLFDLEELRIKIVKQIIANKLLFKHCQSDTLRKIEFIPLELLLAESIISMPLLGYFLFELLLEYILLFQDDSVALQHRDKGEFYVWHHKQLAFDLCPHLLRNFELSKFNPSIGRVIAYLQAKSANGIVIRKFSPKHFVSFLATRLAHLVRSKLLAISAADFSGIKEITSWDELSEQMPSLLGLLIHRELRNIPVLCRLNEVYTSLRAKTIWEYWHQEKILIPYNCLIPKGEVGLNPLFPELSYSIFRASIDAKSHRINLDRELCLKLGTQIITMDSNVTKP